LVTALSVAREREQGTFDQLLVTPLHPFEREWFGSGQQ
jgi:ABC-2 type transport system permease protein